jgi:sugar transferase (PEP-CTERM/EpsH1 system associated)
MKRIVVGHAIYAFHSGGMERGLLNLINYGDHERFRHVVLCLTDAGEYATMLTAPDCQVVELRKNPGNDWRLPSRIAQAARRHGVDIMHARGWPALVESAIGARLAGISRTMYTFHGKTIDDLKGISFKRRWLQKAMIRSYRKVITLNQQMRADLAAECSMAESRIGIINNGVDIEKFRPRCDRASLRREFGLPIEKVIIGNVARLDPVKNHEVVLRALRRLVDQQLEVLFLLVGDGPNRAALEREVARLALGPHVRLYGHSNAVTELLNCMDVYVQSSFYEGFSNTVLEAMACGVPVIATDVGGTTDIFSDGSEGYFFKSQDDSTLASLLFDLARDETQRRRMGERARKSTVEQFPIQSMVRGYESAYSELAQP